MKTNKMKSSNMNNLPIGYSSIFSSPTVPSFSLLLLLSFLTPLLVFSQSAALWLQSTLILPEMEEQLLFNGEEGIATDGDSFRTLQMILQEESFHHYLKGWSESVIIHKYQTSFW